MAGIRALALAGPTATGKTALAVALAEKTGAEIVSCDSRQIYRGLTIGTAKPTEAERARAAHHLLDVADPTERWSAGRWADEARRALAGIAERGRAALIVGGSGLYLRALRDGLAPLPRDPLVRRELQSDADARGLAALHAELTELDPAAAAGIHPHNRERLLRALEVCRITRQPMSALWARGSGSNAFPVALVVLDRPRPELAARIDERVEAMFDAGLLAEVDALVRAGFAPEWPAYRTLGYPEAVRCLRGEWGRAESIARIQIRSRQFAKRQRTWFRAEPDAEWIEMPAESIEPIVERLAARLDSLTPRPIA
jgi:tRNA dimethylallyltransferase